MLKGSITALITPMLNGGVDMNALEALLEWHVLSGSHGVVVLGTTGESATLTDQERQSIVDKTLAHVDGRIPVLIGTGSNATAKAIAYTQWAKDAGADAALIVTPYYNKPDQAGLYAHFSAIADAVDIPQVLYNVPSRTGCDLLSATAARLAQHPNIVGLKDATGDLGRLTEMIEQHGAPMALLSGDDGTVMEFMMLGGDGAISVTANIVPDMMVGLMQTIWEGDFDKARRINRAMRALHQGLFVAPNPIPSKWLLASMGKISSSELRLPLVSLDESHQNTLTDALAVAKAATI